MLNSTKLLASLETFEYHKEQMEREELSIIGNITTHINMLMYGILNKNPMYMGEYFYNIISLSSSSYREDLIIEIISSIGYISFKCEIRHFDKDPQVFYRLGRRITLKGGESYYTLSV